MKKQFGNIKKGMGNDMEIIGYYKEYYSMDNKLIGIVNNVEKDRNIFGFFGQKIEKFEHDIYIGKKVIKEGTRVKTQLQIMCGR